MIQRGKRRNSYYFILALETISHLEQSSWFPSMPWVKKFQSVQPMLIEMMMKGKR